MPNNTPKEIKMFAVMILSVVGISFGGIGVYGTYKSFVQKNVPKALLSLVIGGFGFYLTELAIRILPHLFR